MRLVVAVAALISSPVLAQTVSVVDATQKVYQGDTVLPPVASQATIYAAQNEFEGFQIVVTGPASTVSVTANALTGPGGAQILPSSASQRGNIMVYREAFISLPATGTQATDPAAKEGQAPDALVPQIDEFYREPRNASVASVSAGQNAVFFVDVQVPQNATAGVYTGSVTVRATGIATDVPVTLTVWPFALPSTPTLKSVIPFEWNAVTAQYPSVKTCCGDADAQLHLLHALMGLNHRITIDALDYGNADLNAFKTNFAAYIDGNGNTLLAGAKPTILRYGGGHGTGNTLSTWRSFFQQNGWLDRLVDYAADEPAWGANSTWCSLQSAAAEDTAAGIRSMTTAAIADAQAATCNGQKLTLGNINVFIPNVDQVQPLSMGSGQSTMGDYASWKTGTLNGQQNEVWEYQSCDSWNCDGHVSTGWPSYAIDHSAIRNRALEWISFRNGITGELYWQSATSWVNSPKAPWTNQYATGGQGDGTLLYPGAATNAQVGGTHDIPIASLRLKMIREGVEDFEYMTILRNLGGGAYADAAVDGVFATAHSVTGVNPQTLYTARYNVACQIVTTQNPTWTCDPSTWGTGSVTVNPTLSVTLTGTGTGNVVSSPTGISCGSSGGACAAQFPAGTVVTLAATPDGSFTFTGFGGACTGPACALTLNASQSVTAAFSSCGSSDCFDRPDAPTLGSNWNTYSGAMQISGGSATNSLSGATVASVWQTTIGTDQDVSADCKLTGSGSNCGVMARWVDANNYYYAYVDSGMSAVHLWRLQNGAVTNLGGATRTIAAGSWYQLRLVVQGNALSVYFNDEASPCISATDSALTSGSFGGLHAYGGAAQAVWYGSFTIKAPPVVDGFSVAVSPASQTVQQGGTATYIVSTAVTSGNAQAVTLSVSGMPAGATASFSPATVSAGGSSTLTIATSASTPAGGSSLTVSAAGTTATKTAAATLNVQGPIWLRAQATKSYGGQATKSLNLTMPSSVQANDLLVATVFAGQYPTQRGTLSIATPSGWTLVAQTAHGATGFLRIYRRVATASDAGRAYTWTTNLRSGAAMSVLAYVGASGLDLAAAQDNASAGTTYATPAATTAAAGDVLVSVHAGWSQASPPATWSTPAGMTARAAVGNGGLLSLSEADATQAAAGSAGPFTATASRTESWALTALVAVKR
ncbi:MAG: glycoside hydrolase domain-containing protein [Myxococcales bacterium]|nr:DUF4091 domain-containing protein [Myxococcales bacterium]